MTLLHNAAGLVNTEAADPNNHFDLLYFDPNRELIDRIKSLGYSITQVKQEEVEQHVISPL
mgnify:CR=1 FL=1